MASAAVLSPAKGFALNIENPHRDSVAQLAVESALTGMIIIPETAFSVSAPIVAVMEEVQAICGIPVSHQRLLLESSVIENTALLIDLHLPAEGAVLQLVVQLPPKEQVAEARQAMTEAARALDVLDIEAINEMKNLATPPQRVQLVLQSIMHLRAGLDSNIEVDARGRVKDCSWKASKEMLKNTKKFLADLRAFTSLIEKGDVPEQNLQAVCKIRHRLGTEFSREFSHAALAASGLTVWVVNVIRYHEIICKIRKEFTGFDIMAEIREQLER